MMKEQKIATKFSNESDTLDCKPQSLHLAYSRSCKQDPSLMHVDPGCWLVCKFIDDRDFHTDGCAVSLCCYCQTHSLRTASSACPLNLVVCSLNNLIQIYYSTEQSIVPLVFEFKKKKKKKKTKKKKEIGGRIMMGCNSVKKKY